jgi:hypothetical protein
MYGAYRVVLRTVPGLTTGDGWTLRDTGLRLASIVNDRLPRDARLKMEHFERGTKWGRWSGGNEARYWVERGWPPSRTSGDFRPTPDEAVGKRLPKDERDLLSPVLFGSSSTRGITVDVLANAKQARTHSDLCDALANSGKLSEKIAPLPAFSRFADAAMHAMRELWDEINADEAEQAPSIEKLARSPNLQSSLARARELGSEWLRAPGRSDFPHHPVVTHLAQTMRDARNPLDQLRTLARHHHERGGGRRWFREQAGKMVPLVKKTDIAASDYRFRLLALCRLAAQCGVVRMSHALQAVARNELSSAIQLNPDDEEGDAL